MILSRQASVGSMVPMVKIYEPQRTERRTLGGFLIALQAVVAFWDMAASLSLAQVAAPAAEQPAAKKEPAASKNEKVSPTDARR